MQVFDGTFCSEIVLVIQLMIGQFSHQHIHCDKPLHVQIQLQHHPVVGNWTNNNIIIMHSPPL